MTLRPDELALAHGPRLARFLADGAVQLASVAEFGVDVAALSAQALGTGVARRKAAPTEPGRRWLQLCRSRKQIPQS